MRTLGRGCACSLLSINASAYHYAIVARNIVKADQVGLVLVVRTTLFVVEAVVANLVAEKNIGNEFQE
jgi:hypothetical protein